MPAPDLERWYHDHASALFALALDLTRNEAETRDALQEVFRKLTERPELLNNVRDPRGFLLRLTHHAVVDLIRRRDTQRRAHEALSQEPVVLFAPTEDPDEAAFRNELAQALGTLPTEQRVVVHLKLWEGFTFERIAEVLEIPLHTAASRYRYGLDKLRGQLRPLYDEIRET